MDLVTMFLKGGIVMWPILLLSLLGMYITIERWLTLRQSKAPTGQFQLKLRKLLEGKNVQLAQEFCITEKSPAGRIVGAGLEKIHHGAGRVRQAMEDQGREEIMHLERRLGIIASVAGIAPMLGFLGTVTGLIAAFQAVANASGQPSPIDLADGIWEALITTVFGLVVGIPMAGAYNYFVNAIHMTSSTLERVSRDALDAIEESLLLNNTSAQAESTISLRREESSS